MPHYSSTPPLVLVHFHSQFFSVFSCLACNFDLTNLTLLWSTFRNFRSVLRFCFFFPKLASIFISRPLKDLSFGYQSWFQWLHLFIIESEGSKFIGKTRIALWQVIVNLWGFRARPFWSYQYILSLGIALFIHWLFPSFSQCWTIFLLFSIWFCTCYLSYYPGTFLLTWYSFHYLLSLLPLEGN